MERSPVISATTEQEGATAAASEPIFHREASRPLNNCLHTDYELVKSTSMPKYCLCFKKTLQNMPRAANKYKDKFGEEEDIWWLHLSHLADQTNKRLKCPRVAEPHRSHVDQVFIEYCPDLWYVGVCTNMVW